MKAMLREGENVYHSQMHNVPKCQKQHAIPLLQIQTSFTTQKKERNYGICLILMYNESKYKSFDALLLLIRRKNPMQMQKTRSKKGYKQSMHSRQ
jgi:hypothetical protein